MCFCLGLWHQLKYLSKNCFDFLQIFTKLKNLYWLYCTYIVQCEIVQWCMLPWSQNFSFMELPFYTVLKIFSPMTDRFTHDRNLPVCHFRRNQLLKSSPCHAHLVVWLHAVHGVWLCIVIPSAEYDTELSSLQYGDVCWECHAHLRESS